MPSRSVRVFQVDVFTDRLFAGNPAGVVLGAAQLDEEEMQAIARELNNSDSAFVLPAAAADHDVQLRFFTPAREVGFVGHATVAAHVARLAAGECGTGRLRQQSRDAPGTHDQQVPCVGSGQPAGRERRGRGGASRGDLIAVDQRQRGAGGGVVEQVGGVQRGQLQILKSPCWESILVG